MESKPVSMKNGLATLLLMLVIMTGIQAQFTRYIVRFKDKGGSPYSFSSPQAYLSARAIDRRTRYGIGMDSADLPVTPAYVNQVRNIPNVTVLNVSRWLNALSVQTTDASAVNAIQALPFVQSVAGLAARLQPGEAPPGRNKFAPEETILPLPVNERQGDIQTDFFNYGAAAYNEIHLHNGEFLHNIGLRGQGMQVAMLDGGFQNFTGLRAFDSANLNGQVLGTWDFVARNATVTDDHPHGMQCLSTIAANIPGQFVGKAPKASFWLFRTEDVFSEYPIEEFNWVCGAERADSSGADVISSSLGYYDFDNPVFNYTYSNMDGNTTISVKGADLAAKKGLMVFNSAGNEGGNSWHFLITPSDGDSVVAVGAVNSNGVIGGFSSYGPSADGRVKPDMASVGVAAVIQTTVNTIGAANGTSFACPNMAGMATCLWQGFPEFNNMKIIRALQEAGHRFSNPDDRTGYGIPDLKMAFSRLLAEYATVSAAVNNPCEIRISWNSKDVSAMRYEVERKAPGEMGYTKVGDVDATGGAILASRGYEFINTLAGTPSGIFTYRIRQIIDTTQATFASVYIDSAQVTVNDPCTSVPVTATRIYLQPNPVTSDIAVLVVETTFDIPDMTIAVFNAKGQLIRQWKDAKTSGKKVLEFPAGRLPKGAYYIRVMNGSAVLGTVEMIRL